MIVLSYRSDSELKVPSATADAVDLGRGAYCYSVGVDASGDAIATALISCAAAASPQVRTRPGARRLPRPRRARLLPHQRHRPTPPLQQRAVQVRPGYLSSLGWGSPYLPPSRGCIARVGRCFTSAYAPAVLLLRRGDCACHRRDELCAKGGHRSDPNRAANRRRHRCCDLLRTANLRCGVRKGERPHREDRLDERDVPAEFTRTIAAEDCLDRRRADRYGDSWGLRVPLARGRSAIPDLRRSHRFVSGDLIGGRR